MQILYIKKHKISETFFFSLQATCLSAGVLYAVALRIYSNIKCMRSCSSLLMIFVYFICIIRCADLYRCSTILLTNKITFSRDDCSILNFDKILIFDTYHLSSQSARLFYFVWIIYKALSSTSLVLIIILSIVSICPKYIPPYILNVNY